MANQPVRVRTTALIGLTALLLIGGCGATSRTAGTVADPPASQSATAGQDPTGGADAGGVGPGPADYVVPDSEATPVPVPEPASPGLADPAGYGLTPQDETAALAAAEDFVNTIWTWDASDTGDRAGLERALLLATEPVQHQLAPYLEQPLYSRGEWAQLAAADAVGSASEVLWAEPAVGGTFDATTYTVQVTYRTYTLGGQGYYVDRPEDPRFATLLLTRDPDGAWLVADIPYLDAEQLIETASP